MPEGTIIKGNFQDGRPVGEVLIQIGEKIIMVTFDLEGNISQQDQQKLREMVGRTNP